jgi:hypothetical protein
LNINYLTRYWCSFFKLIIYENANKLLAFSWLGLYLTEKTEACGLVFDKTMFFPTLLIPTLDYLFCHMSHIHDGKWSKDGLNIFISRFGLQDYFFFIPITVALYLSLNRNQSKNLPETVDLGLGILCTIVTRKEEYKVDITFNIFIIVLSDQPMTFRMLGVTKLVNVRL